MKIQVLSDTCFFSCRNVDSVILTFTMDLFNLPFFDWRLIWL